MQLTNANNKLEKTPWVLKTFLLLSSMANLTIIWTQNS